MSLGKVPLLFGKKLQHVVFAGPQALRHKVHDDIVQVISAAIIEGANVIAWLEVKTRTVRKQRQGHLPSVTSGCTGRQVAGAGFIA